MSYVAKNLISGEKTVYVGKISRFIYVLPVIYIFSGLVIVRATQSDGITIGLSVIGYGVFWLIVKFIQRNTTELSVTNKRIIGKRGFIERHSIDIRLSRVESIVINQGILGRIFDFGDVGVVGSGGTPDYIKDIDSPLDIRNNFMVALEGLGGEQQCGDKKDSDHVFSGRESLPSKNPTNPWPIIIFMAVIAGVLRYMHINEKSINPDEDMADVGTTQREAWNDDGSTENVGGEIDSPQKNSFREIFDKTKFWTADWGNDIRAAISKAPCKDLDLLNQGYEYKSYSSLPISRIPSPSQAWYTFDDRAVTVTGCWMHKGDGLIHFKMKRKKDNKIFEQDINLLDGSWEAIPLEQSNLQ